MHTFHLTVDCDGAAFKHMGGDSEAARSIEVARILRTVADVLATTPLTGGKPIPLIDSGRHHVGTARFMEDGLPLKPTVHNVRQGERVPLFILFLGKSIEGIYTNKVQAEDDMRLLRNSPAFKGTAMHIVDTITEAHDNFR
jgi:hypothetical protein